MAKISGSNHHMAKLTEKNVEDICLDLMAGKTLSELSIRHNVAKSSISSIIHGRTWAKFIYDSEFAGSWESWKANHNRKPSVITRAMVDFAYKLRFIEFESLNAICSRLNTRYNLHLTPGSVSRWFSAGVRIYDDSTGVLLSNSYTPVEFRKKK